MTAEAAAHRLTPRRILGVCVARVFLFASFMTVAATIPLLMREWNLGAAAAGSIVSSFTIAYAASLFGFAWTADHYGAKRMTVLSAIAAAAASLAFGFLARDWWTAMVLYGLVGLAQGGVYTPLIMVFSDESPPERRGRAMGWLIASTSVGYAASLSAAGLGLLLGGWRMAFILTGVLPAVGALILIAALGPLPNRVHPRPLDSSAARELVHNRPARLLVGGYVAHSWELLGMWAWIPAYLAATFALKGGGSAAAAISGAWLSGILHLFGAVAAFTMGRMSDRSGRRPVLITLAAAGALGSFSVGWLVHAPSFLLVPLAFAYAFACIGDSPVLSTALAETVKPGYLGAALAWRGLAGFGAGALAPLAVGLALDATSAADPAVSWGVGFATLGLGGALATGCALALGKRWENAATAAAAGRTSR
ncbi:MAG TPA: MFS transporter [Arenicellales bacterium]|nr:MFS transporter [Arenicellales bacterium]